MKKYIMLIPIIIFPYFYLVTVMILILLNALIKNECVTEELANGYIILQVVFLIFTLIVSILSTIRYARGYYDLSECVRFNLLVKGIHIPAYVLHFIMGTIGLLMGIFGLAFLLWAVFIDFITIIISGIHSIGCTVRMTKDGIITKKSAVFMGIGSFLYCIDVVIAIVYYVKTQKDWFKRIKN